MGTQLLGIGITGKSLTDLERRIISDVPPYAVVLFGRNIGEPRQVRELVAEIKSLANGKPPLFMIDEEGGRVDRLRTLIPGLPSAEAYAEGEEAVELSAWGGRVIGMALRYFDIEVDLAPVADVRGAESPKGLERRTFSDDVETVVELAGAFMRGLHESGTASCLKHFPGIGLGLTNPHYGATIIDVSAEELAARDLVPFVRLGNEAGAVMIGHGTYPRIDAAPATLSRPITTDLLRNTAGFEGLAVSDDMEMHAVSDIGTYEEITERAVMAGNDVIMFASHIERIPDLQRFLHKRAMRDAEFGARFAEGVARGDRYREHVERIRAQAPGPVAHFDDLIDEAERLVEEFTRTRPPHELVVPDSERRKGSRTPGSGKTGREEWT